MSGAPTVLAKEMLAYARDAAAGMEFLAGAKCVHRDLAARNVLVDKPLARIADFGLARYLDEEYQYIVQTRQRKLPTKWLAPECILYGVCVPPPSSVSLVTLSSGSPHDEATTRTPHPRGGPISSSLPPPPPATTIHYHPPPTHHFHLHLHHLPLQPQPPPPTTANTELIEQQLHVLSHRKSH